MSVKTFDRFPFLTYNKHKTKLGGEQISSSQIQNNPAGNLGNSYWVCVYAKTKKKIQSRLLSGFVSALAVPIVGESC
jgi:hypothetical protein